MNVIFDNIIFSLQRTGGISVVWKELLSRARVDKDLQCTELDYKQGMAPRFMERYRIPDFTADVPSIFHSSYFRILPQKGVYNVTTVHDLTYHYYRKGLAKAVHLWEEERALRHSEAVICISENTKRDLLSFYPWVNEEKIHVVYNGVSDAFCPIPSAQKKGYLLFLGNSTVDYKRYDVAQEVARLTGLELKTPTCVSQSELNTLYNIACCHLNSLIQGIVYTIILLGYPPHVFVLAGISLNQLFGVIRRSSVHNDMLDVLVGLALHALQ